MSEVTSEEPAPKQFSILRNWKKYTFEFIMLFLAVFLGFVAENARENFAEKQQSIELANSFYEELKNDSIEIAVKIQGRVKKEAAIEYLVPFFKDSSLASTSKKLSVNLIWGLTARTPIIFTPRTVVLEQLKSSGSLRYFKNQELQKLIGDLFVAIDYIQARQEYESSIFYNYIEPLMTSHMDFEFQSKLFEGNNIFERLTEYENSNEYIPFHLSQAEKIDRQKIMNVLGYYRTNGLKSTRLIPFEKYREVNAATLKALRNEYHLK